MTVRDEHAPRHVGDFKLSITRALADQLAAAIQKLDPAPLTASALGELESRSGVYELYFRGSRVYVGKASVSLPLRLAKHLRKLSGRLDVSASDVQFICLYMDEDLEASAPERMLIGKYRPDGEIPWNTNGFGNNDPGKQRDRSEVSENHFDALHPINLDYMVGFRGSEEGPATFDLGMQRSIITLDSYLKQLKAALPFNVRYEVKAAGVREWLRKAHIELPEEPESARLHLLRAFDALPEYWQLTIFPGYVIIYPKLEEFPSAVEWWRKDSDGKTIVSRGPNRRSAAERIEEDATPDLED